MNHSWPSLVVGTCRTRGSPPKVRFGWTGEATPRFIGAIVVVTRRSWRTDDSLFTGVVAECLHVGWLWELDGFYDIACRRVYHRINRPYHTEWIIRACRSEVLATICDRDEQEPCERTTSEGGLELWASEIRLV